MPIALREPREVRSDSLQTPHDPAVTYSGHKGKGYEVQVAETCESDNAVSDDHARGGDAVERKRLCGDDAGDRRVE